MDSIAIWNLQLNVILNNTKKLLEKWIIKRITHPIKISMLCVFCCKSLSIEMLVGHRQPPVMIWTFWPRDEAIHFILDVGLVSSNKNCGQGSYSLRAGCRAEQPRALWPPGVPEHGAGLLGPSCAGGSSVPSVLSLRSAAAAGCLQKASCERLLSKVTLGPNRAWAEGCFCFLRLKSDFCCVTHWL